MASRRRGANRWTGQRTSGLVEQPLPRLVAPLEPEEARATQQGEDLWERHGRAAYALACVLLGDERAAAQAVTLAMTDLARSSVGASADDARRSLARHLYWRSEELASETTRTLRLPPAMVWIGQLAQLQRTCLALCLFGGHTHREAAALARSAADGGGRSADLRAQGARPVGRRRHARSPLTGELLLCL